MVPIMTSDGQAFKMVRALHRFGNRLGSDKNISGCLCGQVLVRSEHLKNTKLVRSEHLKNTKLVFIAQELLGMAVWNRSTLWYPRDNRRSY